MDYRYNQYRGTSPVKDGRKSFVISDSDEDVCEDTSKDRIFVIESSDSSGTVSRSSTPQRVAKLSAGGSTIMESSIKRRIKKYIPIGSEGEGDDDGDDDGEASVDSADAYSWDEEQTLEDSGGSQMGKRKDVSHDVTKENIKDLRLTDSFEDRDDRSDGPMEDDAENKYVVRSSESDRSGNDVVNVDSDSAESRNGRPEADIALSLAKQEIGVGNIDPLVAQKRALLVCKLGHLQDQLGKTKLLLSTGNIDLLPDRGEKLRSSIMIQEKEIEEISSELENTPLTQNTRVESQFVKEEARHSEAEYYPREVANIDNGNTSYFDVDHTPTKAASSQQAKGLGKKAQETLDKEMALTVDRLQDLHGSLVARPSEDERAEDPQGLKVKLMPHQQHALAWLLWREQQRPAGGVLADDMGLGKTLTMISLIIASAAKESLEKDADSDEEWIGQKKPIRQKGGTLVVCPASLLSQWESEIHNRCKRGMLSVEVYHGINRENVPKRLARNDVVITTYNILSREYKTKSTVYRIQWKRVILDEAHIIRNHKSQASIAACEVLATKRWALTGTPIQNKEMDLYSILKFLKCSPFDDLRVWKRWVDNKNASGRQRLATVMKTLMLRRTKQELQANGALDSLPDKCIEVVSVKLDPQEQLVYEKVLIYSRTLFAQFLSQRAEKDHGAELAAGKFDRPSFLSNPNKNTQFTKAQNKLLSLHADVKTHEILVLLLRLRQICVHPCLIHAMLDQEEMKESGIADTENVDPSLLLQIGKITLHDTEDDNDTNEKEIGVDHRVTTNLLTSKNPVFESKRASSKMKAVLGTVTEILQKGDKLIIVSQWTSMLEIVATHLSSIKGATFKKFTGNVPIKERQGIMDSFNASNRDPRILLLSLTAGGVGLNLVGGNHLLLIDIHWNPQLESQAQDRIYRFGQKKDVFVYKFICKDTIEERIKHLQDKKLEVAQNVLSGDKDSSVSKLTLNDLKSLFAL